MQGGLALANSARPQSVHQNAIAIAARGLLIDSFHPDTFDGGKHRSTLLLYFRRTRCGIDDHVGTAALGCPPERRLAAWDCRFLFEEQMEPIHPPIQGPSTRDNYPWLALAICAGILLSCGCDVQRRKSDAELGLTPQQAAGRQLYDQYCD